MERDRKTEQETDGSEYLYHLILMNTAMQDR